MATKARKTLPWPLSVLLSCLAGAFVPFAHLLAYWGDSSPGISHTLVKCTTYRGINHPSTPKGRQLVEWPHQDSYKDPKKLSRGPCWSFSPVLLGPLCQLPTFWRTGVIYPPGYRSHWSSAQYPGGSITPVGQKVVKIVQWPKQDSYTGPQKPSCGPFRSFSALLVGPLCHLPTSWRTWVIYPPGYHAHWSSARYPGG